MIKRNFINYIDILTRFVKSDFVEILDGSELCSEVFYGYIDLLTSSTVSKTVLNKYYGKEYLVNDWFFIDYVVEDYIRFGKCFVPTFKEEFLEPIPLSPDIAIELNRNKCICLETVDELYDFLVNGELPNRKVETIPSYSCVKRG